MRSPATPPPPAAPVFSVADGLAAGLSRGVLDGPSYVSTSHGLRHPAAATPHLSDIVRALQKRSPGAVASQVTAARLWGIWLPRGLDRGEVHLARTREEGGAPRRAGVVGHELHPHDTVLLVHGVRITDPATTWVSLAPLGLSLHDLVAAGDSLLQRADGPAGRNGAVAHPLSSLSTLRAAAVHARGRRGMRLVRAALPLLRAGVDSRPESLLRLSLVDAGFAEPEVNPLVSFDAGPPSRPDLVWRQARVCLEYEGDHHRVDQRQWRRDLERDRRRQAAGWTVLRATGDALTRNGFARLCADLASALGEDPSGRPRCSAP